MSPSRPGPSRQGRSYRWSAQPAASAPQEIVSSPALRPRLSPREEGALDAPRSAPPAVGQPESQAPRIGQRSPSVLQAHARHDLARSRAPRLGQRPSALRQPSPETETTAVEAPAAALPVQGTNPLWAQPIPAPASNITTLPSEGSVVTEEPETAQEENAIPGLNLGHIIAAQTLKGPAFDIQSASSSAQSEEEAQLNAPDSAAPTTPTREARPRIYDRTQTEFT